MIHDAVVHKITRRNPFLQDWPYYGVIDILNPVATAQYQHSVTIPTKPGMAHDFRDLRFFQADGTEIPFWNESKTDGSTSFNWFKPYSASNRQAYVFYGNRDAVSQSSGDKTFEFFDDFLGSTLSTVWADSSSGQAVVSGSVMMITANSATARTISTIQTWDQPYAVIASVKSAHAGVNPQNEIIGFNSMSTSHGQICYFSNSSSTYAAKYNNYTGSSNLVPQTGWSAGVYHRIEVARVGTTKATWKVDNANTVDNTTGYLYELSSVQFGVSDASGAIVYCDWVAVRKYTETEPVCQLNQSGLRNPAYR